MNQLKEPFEAFVDAHKQFDLAIKQAARHCQSKCTFVITLSSGQTGHDRLRYAPSEWSWRRTSARLSERYRRRLR